MQNGEKKMLEFLLGLIVGYVMAYTVIKGGWI